MRHLDIRHEPVSCEATVVNKNPKYAPYNKQQQQQNYD